MDDDEEDFYGDHSPPAQAAAAATSTTTATVPTTNTLPIQQLPSRDNSTPKPAVASAAASQSQAKNDVNMSEVDGVIEGPNPAGDGADEEEVEEYEIEEDDDIEFVIEPKAGQPVAPPNARYNIRGPPSSATPQRQTSVAVSDFGEQSTPAAGAPQPATTRALGTAVAQSSKTTVPRGPTPPPTATSTLDINAVPVYSSIGDKLTSINIDDLPSKPWRNPGADVTDYFNYGFDEFTWTAYCQKQENTRKEFDPKKMMEDMMMFGNMLDPATLMNMSGGNTGNMSTALPNGMPPLPPGMPPEMAAAMMQGGMPGMPGMPQMAGGMSNMGSGGFGMDMMSGPSGPNRQDMSQQMFMHGGGGQGAFSQNIGQFSQATASAYADEQQRFEQQKYMQQQQRLQQQQRNFSNPNAGYGNFQNQNPNNPMGRGRGVPGVQGGPGNAPNQRGW